MSWTAPRTWNTGELVTKTIMDTHVRDNFNAVLPLATLILRVAPYTTVETAVEDRWLQCNGVAISRTTYAALFNYFNSLTPALPFGTGDGSTTFNLPDLRGRAAWAEGEHTEVDDIGDSDGVSIANRTPSHHHTEGARDGTGGTSPFYGGNNTLFMTAVKTSGNANLVDKPAYLVVGSYFIKFTA